MCEHYVTINVSYCHMDCCHDIIMFNVIFKDCCVQWKVHLRALHCGIQYSIRMGTFSRNTLESSDRTHIFSVIDGLGFSVRLCFWVVWQSVFEVCEGCGWLLCAVTPHACQDSLKCAQKLQYFTVKHSHVLTSDSVWSFGLTTTIFTWNIVSIYFISVLCKLNSSVVILSICLWILGGV